jgi:hypothetical protein
MRFTSKSLKRFLSKKAKKSRKLKQRRQRTRRLRKTLRKSQRGGNTYDRTLPIDAEGAVDVKPMNWNDGEEKDPLVLIE